MMLSRFPEKRLAKNVPMMMPKTTLTEITMGTNLLFLFGVDIFLEIKNEELRI